MNNSVKNWRDTKKIHQSLGKVGKIITWTKVFVAPTGFEHEVPYSVAIVEFNPSTGSGRKRMAVQVVDCPEEELTEGLEVITIVRRIGKSDNNDVINYGIKCKPL